jgi:hypothetical protein
LTSLSSKKLTYGHSNGGIETQDEFVEALASGESNFTSINLSDQSVDISGKVALVRHNLQGTTHNKGASPCRGELRGICWFGRKKGKIGNYWPGKHFKR